MGEEEEGREAKGLSAPRAVRKEEREEHKKTHVPFQGWCKAHAKGRERRKAHMRRSKEEKRDERIPGGGVRESAQITISRVRRMRRLRRNP